MYKISLMGDKVSKTTEQSLQYEMCAYSIEHCIQLFPYISLYILITYKITHFCFPNGLFKFKIYFG